MVRRDDDGSPAEDFGSNPPSRCDDPAGVSPASVSVGAPSSRPAAEGETPTAEAGFQKRASQQQLISKKQARGPQHEVKPEASTEEQSEICEVIADLNPIFRGCGAYFGTGNAARSFNQIDSDVHERLRSLRLKRAGRNLDAQTATTWTRDYFWNLGLHRLRGTVQYPEATQYRWHESPPASRVRAIRTHGFNGGRTETPKEGK